MKPQRTRRLRTLFVFVASAVVVTTTLAQGPDGPRVGPVPESQWSEEQRSIAAQFASSGMTNAIATYVHYPTLAQALLAHERYISNESTLPPRHRLLLGLRTAWLTRSDYLWAHRAAAARRAGFTADEIARIAQVPEAKWPDAFEATLIRAADELLVDAFLSDESWRVLTEGVSGQRYDINQMIDLVDTVGAYTIHAGLLNSLGVQIEPGINERRPTNIPYARLRRGRTSGSSAASRASRLCPRRIRTAPSGRRRTSFRPSCAIHRPIACAAPSTITSTAVRPSCRGNASCC